MRSPRASAPTRGVGDTEGGGPLGLARRTGADLAWPDTPVGLRRVWPPGTSQRLWLVMGNQKACGVLRGNSFYRGAPNSIFKAIT